MKAPDRIWASFFHGEDSHVYPVSVSDKYSPAGVQYLRASPELLALIEAARGLYRAGLPYTSSAYDTRENVLAIAALAFARTQDHPDAG